MSPYHSQDYGTVYGLEPGLPGRGGSRQGMFWHQSPTHVTARYMRRTTASCCPALLPAVSHMPSVRLDPRSRIWVTQRRWLGFRVPERNGRRRKCDSCGGPYSGHRPHSALQRYTGPSHGAIPYELCRDDPSVSSCPTDDHSLDLTSARPTRRHRAASHWSGLDRWNPEAVAGFEVRCNSFWATPAETR
jgi:hypothetical protein